MTTIALDEQIFHTSGKLPALGKQAPLVELSKTDLSTVTFDDFPNQAILLNIYPSIDTQMGLESVRYFKQRLKHQVNLVIACVSMDLPFALRRILSGESLEDIFFLSDFRNHRFGELFGLKIVDGPLSGMLARAVIVLNKNHKVVYTELVRDLSNQPNYKSALEHLEKVA